MAEISTVRLRLRPAKPQDRPGFAAMVGDPCVTRMLARWPYPADPAMIDDFFSRAKAEPERGFAILYGDAFAGTISAGPRIGFMLSRRFWGRGILTEALLAVQSAAFNRGEARLDACVFKDNPASSRVFAKCGWQTVSEGTSFSAGRGEDVEDYQMALTREDWQARFSRSGFD